jgi:hypothetical protein
MWAGDGTSEVTLQALAGPVADDVDALLRGCEFRLVETSPTSRRSMAYAMTHDGSGRFAASRTIRRDEEMGTLEFRIAAVRSSGPVMGPLATARAIVVGLSDPIRVHVDATLDRGGNFLRIVWRDFDVHFPRYRTNSHRVEFEGGLPYLALNSRLVSWRNVMESRGRRGQRYMLREASYAAIAVDVWQVLINRTIGRLGSVIAQRQVAENDVHVPDPILELQPWEQKVLELWMPRHFQMGREDGWRRRLVETLVEGDLLEEQIDHLVQRQFGLGEEFEKLVRTSADPIEDRESRS